MRLVWTCCIALVVGVGASAGEKVVRETWDAAFLDGQKAGHFHTTVVEVERNGQPALRVTRELVLKFTGDQAVAELGASTGDEETPDGKLLGVFMTMNIARNQQLKLTGWVDKNVLKVAVDDPRIPPDQQVRKDISLPTDIMTLLKEESLLADAKQKPKPGDRLSYRLFQPEVDNVIRVDVQVKEWVTMPLDGVNRKLLRVEAKPEKIRVNNMQDAVQLPPLTLFYDEQFHVVMNQGEVPGLGELSLRRTTKEKALAPAGKLRDLGDQSV